MAEPKFDSRAFVIRFSPSIDFIRDNTGRFPSLQEIQNLKQCCDHAIRHYRIFERCRKTRDFLLDCYEDCDGSVILPPDDPCNCPSCASLEKELARTLIFRRSQEIPAKTKRKPRPTNIYLGKNRFNEYKIGQSLDVNLRERTLQSEDPEFCIVKSWKGRSDDEPKLHSMFTEKRKRGEWFVLDSSDLEKIERYFGGIQ